MFKVTGEFEVTLRTPIAVSFVHESGLETLYLDVGKDGVTLRPLEPKPPFTYEGELIEPPTLVKLRIWITKEVQTLVGTSPNLRLPHREHERFEPIITEATRRFVTAVKRRTQQWDLDHRHPVSCYSSKYFHQDEALAMEWPLEGKCLVPREAEGSMVTHVGDLQGDLTEDIWKQVTIEAREEVKLAHYEEAIFDAKTFRQNLRYDTAVLYAAFAAETILHELSANLLERRGGLSNNHIDAVLKGFRNMPSVITLVKDLCGPELPQFNGQKLEKLFKLRNELAHRKKTNATNGQAGGAIRVAEELKALLQGTS